MSHKTQDLKELSSTCKVRFTSNFTTVIEYKYNKFRHPEMLEWVNKNIDGRVDIRVDPVDWENPQWIYPERKMFVAFEDEADALIFKIRYADE